MHRLSPYGSNLPQQSSRRAAHTIPAAFTRFLFLTLCLAAFAAPVAVKAQDTITLKAGYVGAQYDFDLNTLIRGGSGSGRTWALATRTENVPPGIDLGRDGHIKGVPTAVKTRAGRPDIVEPYVFNVVVRDAISVSGRADVPLEYPLKVALPIQPFGIDPSNPDVQTALQTAGVNFARPTTERVCEPSAPDFVLASSSADEETIALTQEISNEGYGGFLNASTLEITNADQMMQATLASDPGASFRKGDYVVVHIIRWKALTKDNKSEVAKEQWALFEKVDKPGGAAWAARIDPDDKDKGFAKRIYGSKRVFVLLLHLNAQRSWDIKYKVAINQRIPQPIQDVIKLAGLLGGGGPGERRDDCTPTKTKNAWGGRLMNIRYAASDVLVKLNTVTSGESGEAVEQSKEYSKGYVNEGRYHWDVSIGMPVKSYKELSFSADGGVVTAKEVNKQNAYGFLNLFPKAVDLDAKSFLTTPHFLLGVPISGKPLDSPIVGVGDGIYTERFKVNLFAGIVFNRVREPRTLAAGETATPGQLENDLNTRRVRKFVFGVNFPVDQFIKAISDKKK